MNRAWSSTVALGVLAVAGRAIAQNAQDEGPVIVGTPREKWSGFNLTKLTAAVDFRYQGQRDKLNDSGSSGRSVSSDRFRELLELSGEATVGHRNLIDLSGSLQLGVEDIFSRDSSDPAAGRESNLVGLYDVNALFFGSSALPTNVYARRQQTVLDRPFSGTIEQQLTEEGVGTRFQTEKTATSVLYFHREDELSGGFGGVSSKVRQDSLSVQSGITLGERSRIDSGYTFDRIGESQSDGYADDYDRHDLNVVHTATFGDLGLPHELRSSLRFYEQGGLQDRNNLRWDELLTLRHTARLETRYRFALDERSVRGENQRLLRGEASITHRLFDSLTSTASAGGQRLEGTGDFTSDNAFASGQLDYTKSVPFGRLDASLGGAFDAQANSELGGTLSIVDENYTFVDGFPVILPRRNIVPGSVIVAPPTGFPLYQEGLDYTLLYFPDRVEVRGIGGRLPNGQALRVSYDAGPEPANDIDTSTTSASVRYSINEGRLNGLALYATYRMVDHAVRGGDPALLRLDDLADTLVGVQYRRSGFDARYEYNRHDSTFDPYSLQRLQAIYTLASGAGSSLNAEWTHEIISFSELDNDVTLDRASLRWNYQGGGSIGLNAGLDFRNENSSVNGESQGFDQILGVTWQRAQTSVYATFRNSILDGPGSDQTNQVFQCGVRRTF